MICEEEGEYNKREEMERDREGNVKGRKGIGKEREGIRKVIIGKG